MLRVAPVAFDAFVVAAAFLDDVPAFALGDGRIALLAGETPGCVRAHAGGLLAAAASPDGTSLVTGGDDGRVARIGKDGQVETLAERPRKWIDRIACGPQGTIAFASGRSAWVHLRNGTTREFPHERAVAGLAFAPKGLRLATATYNKARLLWVATDAPPVELEWKGSHIAVTLSPDGRFVITALQEPGLHGWRLEDGRHLRMTGYPAKVKSWSWSPRGRHLATSGANAAIVWPFTGKDGPMGKAPLELGAYRALVSAVAFHPREDVLAIGYEDGLVLAVRLDDEAEAVVRPAEAPASPISALAWDAAGARLAFGSESGQAGIADISA